MAGSIASGGPGSKWIVSDRVATIFKLIAKESFLDC